ncbi:MAG TPA: hypothetical protein PK324_06670, partial [Nocardioides sp.]|nr:hypothetical protein [Nocardioides sp.]
MRVRVSSRGELSLTKLDEFDRFDIEVAGDTGRAEVALALAELGQPTDDLSHVFVEPAWVVRQGGERSRAQEWRDGWEAM